MICLPDKGRIKAASSLFVYFYASMKNLNDDFLSVKDLVFVSPFNGREGIFFQIPDASFLILIAASISIYIPDCDRNVILSFVLVETEPPSFNS